MLTLSALLPRCFRIVVNPAYLRVNEIHVFILSGGLNSQELISEEGLDVGSVFSHVSDGGLEGLEGNQNFCLNFDSLNIVRLVPDLLHLIILIDLLIKIGAWELIWTWPQVVLLLMVRVCKVAIVGRLSILWVRSVVASLNLWTLLLLVDGGRCDLSVNSDCWLVGSRCLLGLGRGTGVSGAGGVCCSIFSFVRI